MTKDWYLRIGLTRRDSGLGKMDVDPEPLVGQQGWHSWCFYSAADCRALNPKVLRQIGSPTLPDCVYDVREWSSSARPSSSVWKRCSSTPSAATLPLKNAASWISPASGTTKRASPAKKHRWRVALPEILVGDHRVPLSSRPSEPAQPLLRSRVRVPRARAARRSAGMLAMPAGHPSGLWSIHAGQPHLFPHFWAEQGAVQEHVNRGELTVTKDCHLLWHAAEARLRGESHQT